jgi:hypothetical protein
MSGKTLPSDDISSRYVREDTIPCSSATMHYRSLQKNMLPFTRDPVRIVKREGIHHVVTEGYFYKTEAYYTILNYEQQNKPVEPASATVLDAYVVPLCLEKASLAGIPVCSWGISHSFVPTPSIIYGLNYFATSAEYFMVIDADSSKSVIKHITNNGKYPFCFQKISGDSEIIACTGIFGRTVTASQETADIVANIYRLFRIPLVTHVFVREKTGLRLSALTPTRYSKLSDDERELLSAYLCNQEFL